MDLPSQGSLSARGERILFLDADGATDINDLQRLETALGEAVSDHVGVLCYDGT